jgi:hypothetical protein
MSTQEQTAALAQAARMAGLAPSIHNSQPWHWRVEGSTLDLRAERGRQLPITDQFGRMLVISCGAALHHARLALAAEGWAVIVERMPSDIDQDWLARLTVTGRIDVTPEAMRLAQSARVRHTDRRPLSETTVEPAVVDRLRAAASAEHSHLHVLLADGVLELASAANRAQQAEGLDPAWREELAYWSGGERDLGLGVPDAVIPDAAPETTVPARDFGHEGTLSVGPGHDKTAVYAILYGDEDLPEAWLRAGEALSAVWLTSMELGLSLVPLSAAVEVIDTRQALRRLLSGLGEPFLALRLGIADPDHAGPAHPPRLPTEQVVEVVGD